VNWCRSEKCCGALERLKSSNGPKRFGIAALYSWFHSVSPEEFSSGANYGAVPVAAATVSLRGPAKQTGTRASLAHVEGHFELA